MKSFSDLFGDSFNTAMAAMVKEAVVAAQLDSNKELMDRVTDLEATNGDLHKKIRELEDSIETFTSNESLESKIEAGIEAYDFSTIVANELDWDSISGDRGFTDAVLDTMRATLR